MSGCISDDPTFLFTLVAGVNFVPYVLISLDPKSAISEAVYALNIAVVLEAVIISHVPHASLNDIASVIAILVGLSLFIYHLFLASITLAVIFALIGVFGSAAVVSKENVHAIIQSIFGISIGNVVYYIIVVTIIVLLLIIYYYTTKSRLIALITQTVVYSAFVTVSIYWLRYAIPNNWTVCFVVPDWGWIPWWCLFVALTTLRFILLYFYQGHKEARLLQKYKLKLARRTPQITKIGRRYLLLTPTPSTPTAPDVYDSVD
jgi:hypothetical protein